MAIKTPNALALVFKLLMSLNLLESLENALSTRNSVINGKTIVASWLSNDLLNYWN